MDSRPGAPARGDLEPGFARAATELRRLAGVASAGGTMTFKVELAA